jgi:hypothetical protein
MMTLNPESAGDCSGPNRRLRVGFLFWLRWPRANTFESARTKRPRPKIPSRVISLESRIRKLVSVKLKIHISALRATPPSSLHHITYAAAPSRSVRNAYFQRTHNSVPKFPIYTLVVVEYFRPIDSSL